MKIEIDRRSQAILELLSKRYGLSMEEQVNESIRGGAENECQHIVGEDYTKLMDLIEGEQCDQ